MKLYKIGQPWPNEPLFVNKLSCILNSWLVWPALNEKLAAQNPGREKVVQFCLTFPSGLYTTRNPKKKLIWQLILEITHK